MLRFNEISAPAKRVSDLYPNQTSQERFNAIEASKENSRVNRKEVMCITMRHDFYPKNVVS